MVFREDVRRRRYTWREADYTLQSIMDHYCGDVRSEAMLTRGIERLKDIKDAPFWQRTLMSLPLPGSEISDGKR